MPICQRKPRTGDNINRLCTCGHSILVHDREFGCIVCHYITTVQQHDTQRKALYNSI